MKKAEFTELKSLNLGQLSKKLISLKKELTDLIMDKNMNKLKDLKTVSKKKKDIAKISTIFRQKQLLAQLEPKIAEEGLK